MKTIEQVKEYIKNKLLKELFEEFKRGLKTPYDCGKSFGSESICNHLLSYIESEATNES